MIDGIRAVSLPVPDLAAGTQWYGQFLETGPCAADAASATFLLNGYLLTLRVGEPRTQGTVVYWSVDHIEAELDRLTGLGARTRPDIEQFDPHTRQASFTDPFGNAVGLVERRDPSELRARSQRSAEKIALRNVRSTLDGLERTGAEDQKTRRIVRFVIAVAIVGAAALLWSILSSAPVRAPAPFVEKVGTAADTARAA